MATTFIYTHSNVEDMREPNHEPNGTVTAPTVEKNDIEQKIDHLTDLWAIGEISQEQYDRAMKVLKKRAGDTSDKRNEM